MKLTNDMILDEKTKKILELNIKEFTKSEFTAKKINDQYKDLFSKTFDVDNLEFFKLAVLLGYNDTKRTLTGIGKVWEEDKKESARKGAFIKGIAKGLQSIFINYPLQFDKEYFDKKHKTLCKKIRDDDIFKDSSVKFKYGHAQKIVNMAFKYLFCMQADNAYKDIFTQCHMPLDSYTLEWYKRSAFYQNAKKNEAINKNALLKYDDTWSKMDEEQYLAITQAIKDNVEGEPFFVYDKKISLPCYPLYAEFIIWPQMQLHMAAEEFISSYSNKPEDDKKELKKKNLKDKLERIEEIIQEYNTAFQETKTE